MNTRRAGRGAAGRRSGTCPTSRSRASSSRTSRPCCGTPVLFRRALDLMTVLCGDLPVDKVVAIESRGFILGGALADRLGAGFVPVRKPGKLPVEGPQRELRARVRHRHARDARGRGAARRTASWWSTT